MEQCVRMTRAAWRERVRALNEPPRLTAGEEALNAVSHGVGAALAVAGLVLLLLRSDTPLKITASCFYGISLLVMMLMSCLYHALPAGCCICSVPFRRARPPRPWRQPCVFAFP